MIISNFSQFISSVYTDSVRWGEAISSLKIRYFLKDCGEECWYGRITHVIPTGSDLLLGIVEIGNEQKSNSIVYHLLSNLEEINICREDNDIDEAIAGE